MTSSIPTVDLSDLLSGDSEREAAAVEAIRRGYGDFGLVYIKNHGVDLKAVEDFYEAYNTLCERPIEEKASWGGPEIWYQRGWTPPNTEKAVVAGGQPDFKECYFAAPIGMSHQARLNFPEVYCENVWPKNADDFREQYLEIGRKLHSVGLRMLEGCALAFDLPRDTFVRLAHGGAHVSRVLRYLPLTEEQTTQSIVWGEEHTDFNLLTLLPGGRFYDAQGKPCKRPEGRGGLFLRARATAEHPDGRMVAGTPPKGCMVSQVGQQLEILTGGRFLATPHVIKAPEVSGFSRCSLAHFIHVEAHHMLSPLPTLDSDEAIALYRPPVLAGNYAMKTLVDIGLAPPSMLNRLGFRHYERLASQRERVE